MVGYKTQILAFAMAGMAAAAPQPVKRGSPTDLVNGFWDGVGGGMNSAVATYIAACKAPFDAVAGMIGGGNPLSGLGGFGGSSPPPSGGGSFFAGGPDGSLNSPSGGVSVSGGGSSPSYHGSPSKRSQTSEVCDPKSTTYTKFEQQLNIIIQQTTTVTTRIEAIRQHPPSNGQLPDFEAQVHPIFTEYDQIYDLINRNPQGKEIRQAHAATFTKFDQSYHALTAASKGHYIY